MNKEEYIRISNLSVGYQHGKKPHIVAGNLNAVVSKGELVCLLGANGTGKSTLMRTMCGFQPFFDGQVDILGKSIRKMDERAISRLVSVVLTDRIVVPNATVYELVSYGRSPYTGLLGRVKGLDRDMIDQAISQCGIEHKKNDLLTSLSDGERQKAFIAKALAQDTSVIILDEPTAFLDLPARIEVLQLLRRVASLSGKSVLLSTHDLDLALQMADKLWLLHPGGPLVAGNPEDLLLGNALQDLFKSKGIVFDTRTGLFRVEYQHDLELPVKGHGFEYVLLRRAFARKGVKLVPHQDNENTWIEIDREMKRLFRFYQDKKLVASEETVEKIVHITLINFERVT
ncbi:MAG: ABC transporter ATP-binding protein [Mangrovibacterium sp.]